MAAGRVSRHSHRHAPRGPTRCLRHECRCQGAAEGRLHVLGVAGQQLLEQADTGAPAQPIQFRPLPQHQRLERAVSPQHTHGLDCGDQGRPLQRLPTHHLTPDHQATSTTRGEGGGQSELVCTRAERYVWRQASHLSSSLMSRESRAPAKSAHPPTARMGGHDEARVRDEADAVQTLTSRGRSE